MAHDYIPRRDAAFLAWSTTFSGQINANPEQVGLSPLQASEYAALHDAFVVAYYAAAHDRARSAVNVKKKARATAEKQARALARIIQAHPETTNEMRYDLGLTLRNDNSARIARPVDRPKLSATLRFGSTVRITLRDPDSPRRSKPEGVAGATIFSFVGQTPPDSLTEWTNEGITGRTDIDITLERGIVPGSQVWFTACWHNPRGQCGPASEPKYAHIACPMLMFGDAQRRMAA